MQYRRGVGLVPAPVVMGGRIDHLIERFGPLKCLIAESPRELLAQIKMFDHRTDKAFFAFRRILDHHCLNPP